MASTLGDSYVLVTHPIEAASIVGQVRRDIAWLAARCNAVAIVAHSQGGAIAHIALQGEAPSKLRLLFTFGSGLKKLEQLKYLLSSGHPYLRSGVFTLIALPIFSFVLLWFAMFPVMYRPEDATRLFGQIPIMLGWLLASLVFLIAGLGDYVRGFDVSDLQRWTKRLTKMPFDWVDCFAAADPVSDGILIEVRAVKKLSKAVCNEASVVRDHTSYWSNRDQFLLIERLTRPKLRKEAGLPPAPELATDQSHLRWIGARRRWRSPHSVYDRLDRDRFCSTGSLPRAPILAELTGLLSRANLWVGYQIARRGVDIGDQLRPTMAGSRVFGAGIAALLDNSEALAGVERRRNA